MPVLRERKQYQSAGPVGVLRVNTGEQEKYQAISNAADKLTKLAVGEMSRSSKIMGAQKAQEVSDVMTIDPKTGKPQALNWSEQRQFFGRDSAEAYQRVITERFQQEIDVEIREKATQLAIEYENDPYSVEKYEDKMNAYLAAMAETNSVDGKETAYTNYIMSQGSEYISKTTLAMQAERKRREDAKTAARLQEVITNRDNALYEFGLIGDFEKANNIISANESTSTDAESSNLFKAGSTSSVVRSSMSAFAKGSIERLYNQTTSVAERDAIKFAIRTNGKEMSTLSDDLIKQVKSILPFITNQTRQSILSNSQAYSANMSKLEAVKAAQLNARVQRDLRESLIEYNRDNTLASSALFNKLNNAKDDNEFFAFVTEYSKQSEFDQATIRARYLNGQISEDKYNSLIKDERRSILNSIIAAGALDGNQEQIETFRDALSSINPKVIRNLTRKQKAIVARLNKKIPVSFYNREDDLAHVQSLLSGSVNDQRKRLELFLYDDFLRDKGDDLFKEMREGSFKLDDLIEFDKLVIASSISNAKKEAYLAKIDTNRAIGLINNIPNINSVDINKVGAYVRSNGETNLGLSEELKKDADAILVYINEENRNKIQTELTSRESELRQNEDVLRQQLQEEALKLELKSQALGLGSMTGTEKTKPIREEMSNLIKANGIDIFNMNSEAEEFYMAARTTMPQHLIEAFRSLASGTSDIKGADVILNHFIRLSNDPDGRGEFVNRIGSLLSNEDFAILKDAAEIRTSLGGQAKNGSEIILDLKNQATSNLAQTNYDNVFGDKSPSQFVGEHYKDDPMIVSELSATAEYLARTGNDKETIISLLNDIVDGHYRESEYVVDPSLPLGTPFRSRMSLKAIFPDFDERQEFIKRVNSKLPDGYSLGKSSGPKLSSIEEHRKQFGGQEILKSDTVLSIEAGVSEVKEETQIYLMPYGNTDEYQYYAYYKEKRSGELRHLVLIADKDITDDKGLLIVKEGQPYWPMFDKDTMSNYRDMIKQRDIDAELKKLQSRISTEDFSKASTLASKYQLRLR